MLVSHLLYARIHLSTSVILPACLTDAAWKLGIFIQLLSVCQSREMLFTQHQLDEVCVSLALLAAPTQKIKTKFGQFLLGAFISPGLTLCVSVCVIVVGLSVSRAVHPELNLIEKFSVYLWHEIQTTMHLYSFTEKTQNKTLGTLAKTETVFFLLCWAVRSASLEGRNTKAIISCFHDNIGENCSVKIFIWVIFVGQQMQEHMIHSIYFLMI